MTTALTYTVPGRPVTWKRTNEVRGRRVTDAAQRVAKSTHRLRAIAALGPGGRAKWALSGAFAITVVGYYKSAVVGDCDRLVSLAMDAMEGLLYESDRQVRQVFGRVIADGTIERVEVTVTRFAVDPVQAKKATKVRA